MKNYEVITFILGSLFGTSATTFFAALIYQRRTAELRDEFTAMRETIRRNAYSKGYADAKTGKVKGL